MENVKAEEEREDDDETVYGSDDVTVTINKRPFHSTKDFTDITMPLRRPETIVVEYLTSKCKMNNLKGYSDLILDVAQAPDMNFINAEQEAYISKAKPIAKLKERLIARDSLDKQWRELARIEKDEKRFIRSVREFDAHNQEKRDLSRIRAQNEQAIHVIKDREIQWLMSEINKKENRQLYLQEYCENLKLYQDFLSSVVSHTHEFNSIEDILDRFEDLEQENLELLERYKAVMDCIERGRSLVLNLMENKSNSIKGLSNTIQQLKWQYQSALEEAYYWAVFWKKIQPVCRRGARRNNILKAASWNLYLQACKRREEEPESNQEEIIEQFDYIKHTIVDLQGIVTKLRKRKDCQNKYKWDTTTGGNNIDSDDEDKMIR